MPSAHAAIGGSAIERIMLCPGSVKLSANRPNTSSRAAARGTMLHGAMVEVIERGVSNEQLLHMRYTLEEPDARIAIPKALRAFRKFTKGADRVELECKVAFKKNVWGTADIIGEKPRMNLVGDFKFGARIVEAEDNPQMLFYVGAAVADGTLRLQRTHMAIIQPGKTTLKTAYATMRQITAFTKDVHKAAELAFSAKPPLVPGDRQCNWCPSRDTCPARGTGKLRAALKGVDFKSNRV